MVSEEEEIEGLGPQGLRLDALLAEVTGAFEELAVGRGSRVVESSRVSSRVIQFPSGSFDLSNGTRVRSSFSARIEASSKPC
jgi:hypothetical protein